MDDFVGTIQSTRDSLQDGPEDTRKRKRSGSTVKATATEVCDILMTKLSSRLSVNSFISSFVVLDPMRSQECRQDFPESQYKTLVKKYPFLSSDKLKSEFNVVYQNDTFAHHNCDSLTKLFSTIVHAGFQ